MDLQDRIGHEGRWRLRNQVSRNYIVVEGKLEGVTDSYFVINGVKYSLKVWLVVGFNL